MRRALPLFLLFACAHAQPAGKPLPAIAVRTLDGGKVVRLDQLRGPAIVDVWATWCIPCARALPFYARMARETGVRVFAVSTDADDATVREWLRKNPQPFEVLRDPDGNATSELGLREMPTTFLVDAHGTVRARHGGFREQDEPALEREIREMVSAR